jgi:hypothetical protein
VAALATGAFSCVSFDAFPEGIMSRARSVLSNTYLAIALLALIGTFAALGAVNVAFKLYCTLR